jgi:MFS family permease
MLAALLLAQFMAILDMSIVNVALPTMRHDLHASGAGLQLVVAGYLISYAVLLVTGARLGDRLGHGRVFCAGLAVFTAASLACALAPSTGALVAFRFVQGVGAALMMPQVMSLIQTTFSGAARARALSLYSAVIACGAVVGQVGGGLLVAANVLGTGWRPVFMINVPIGVVLLLLAPRSLPRGRGQAHRRLDPAGVLTLSAAILLLVLPLVLGHEEHWPDWCWLSLIASAAMFAAFAAVQSRVGRRGGSPLVAGRVLRAPGFLAGMATLLIALTGYGGFLFAFAVHLQSGLGEGAASAGLTFAPLAAGFAAAGLYWQRLAPRWHGRIIPLGMGASVVSYVLLAMVQHAGGRPSIAAGVVLVALGVAMGAAFSPVIAATLRHVPVADAADASGVLVTVFQLGQVLGVATLGTVYLSLAHAPGTSASGHAIAVTLLVLAGLCAAGTVSGLLLIRSRAARAAAE